MRRKRFVGSCIYTLIKKGIMIEYDSFKSGIIFCLNRFESGVRNRFDSPDIFLFLNVLENSVKNE